MDSTINLLPEKDKQLKRDGQRKQSAEMVEMTKPQDRVFQERVVRMEGLLAFFKNIFRRAPKLPQPKVKVVVPPAPAKTLPPAPKPPAPVTRLETMQDRMPSMPKVPTPPTPPPTGSFLTKLFNRADKVPQQAKSRPVLAVPPPPRVQNAPPPPIPVRRAPAWAPPPPPPPRPPASQPVAAPVPPPPLMQKAPLQQPPGPAPAFPAPAPKRSQSPQPLARSTDAQPMLGASLNVNLVPEQYQPEASVRDRILAASFVGGAVLIVVGISLGLYFYQQRLQDKVAAVDRETEQVNVEITNRERDDLNDAIVLQQRTSDVKRVLDQHVYWDAFFQKLEAVTLPTVAYSTMSADVSGSVTLVAQAKTYNDVGAQLLTYQRAKDFITDVKISGATKVSAPAATPQGGTPPGQTPTSQSLVSFSVSMRVSPTLFYRR